MSGGEQQAGEAPADFVIATYREIADRFGLGSPDAARVRAKRSKWEREPTNHPLDPARVRVPLSAWEQLNPDRPHSAPADRPRSPSRTEGVGPNNAPPNSLPGSDPLKPFYGALALLQDQLERERQRADAAEKVAQEERQRADQRVQASEDRLRGVRELLARQEGELDGLKLAAERAQDLLSQARRDVADAHNRALEANRRAEDADRATLEAEKALEQSRGWRPLARALRAFVNRRGRP